MKSFLEYVAEDILRKCGTDLSHIAVVFPNKRAVLFLNQYLASKSDSPIWSPSYITISDLFRNFSQRTVADPIKLVCELHKSFISQTGINESLDHFYSWGQLLLADFDDIDKNMADADKVFANVRDIHELDDISYLNEEQRQAIQRFFNNFTDDHNSELKTRFLKLWSKIGTIYHDYNRRLVSQGLAYEGALYREVAEADLTSAIQTYSYDHYLFVGFNLIQQVERRLFKTLRRQEKASFYWDFDHSYLSDNDAGYYIKQQMEEFPCELDTTDEDIYANFAQPKEIRYISSTTENAQGRYISQWLREAKRYAAGRQTAIVMCNEALLPTVIHCLPDEVDKVNVTTGYPLSQSPVASLILQLSDLRILGYNPQRHTFRRRYLDTVLRHPYLSIIPEEEVRDMLQDTTAPLLPWMLAIIQRVAHSTTDVDPLFQECVFRAYTLINRINSLIESGDLTVDNTTLQRLINQLIQSTSVPFHGEPLEGIQVMGVLETRNLDFQHLILLSCNEGNMPRGVNDTSFIPYTIRKAHGLTTIDHKVAIYSYYFHRLLQRATDITILYNNSTNDGQTGEMSRFMLQMMVDQQYQHHHIQFKTIQVPATIQHKVPPVIEMEQKSKPEFLSPTAINTYLRCPLRYYYKYECGLAEPEEDSDDTIDNRLFGNIFHEASQRIYERLLEKSHQILRSDIEELLKKRVDIERAVDEAMQKELKVSELRHSMLNGLQLINREVLIQYVRQLLTIDLRLTPFTIIGLECDVQDKLLTDHINTTIGGRIDRLDRIVKDGQECIRVIDYKTGSRIARPLNDIEAVFQQENIVNHSDYYLQTLLYASLVKQRYPDIQVSPALLFIQHSLSEDYDPTLCFRREPITDVGPVIPRFMELLRDTINQMFNPSTAYQPTANSERCTSCPYKLLCL